MSKQIISTDKAPAAVGAYSQAVLTGSLLFTSGQLPIDPAAGKIPEGSINDHAHIVFKNLTAIFSACLPLAFLNISHSFYYPGAGLCGQPPSFAIRHMLKEPDPPAYP